MDVSYSAWLATVEESKVVKVDGFFFLFDRRYTNRLNRMSRVFFEAYAKAVNELAEDEDRFPSLSEIDARMESGAVYAYKDRLMRNTDFFDEVKISGISYLIPRAKRFIDSSGTYTDLIINLDEGSVILPKRKKVSVESMAEALEVEEQKAEEPLEAGTLEEPRIKGEVLAEGAGEAGTLEEIRLKEEVLAEGAVKAEPLEEPRIKGEVLAEGAAKAEPLEEPMLKGEILPERAQRAEPLEELVRVEEPSADKLVKSTFGKELLDKIKRWPVAIVIAIFLIGLGLYFLAPMLTPAQSVYYSTYLKDSNGNTYLTLDINNTHGVENAIEMVFPVNIESLSASGGIVTVSHVDKTVIRLVSNNDASIKASFLKTYSSIPLFFNLSVPEGFDSDVVVHAGDYDITRRSDRIALSFNCTMEPVSFEQKYFKR